MMKKSLPVLLCAMLVAPAFAQEAASPDAPKDVTLAGSSASSTKAQKTVWPAFFALSQWPRTADVVGLRLTIPFSSAQENVTGLDLGFWGKSIYFEGLQVNVLRNHVIDGAAGFQVGIYNTVGSGELLGLQVGLWNEALAMSGAQVGLVNVAGEARGFQVGIINRAETMTGYQVGVINIIRDAELRFCPLVNIGF